MSEVCQKVKNIFLAVISEFVVIKQRVTQYVVNGLNMRKKVKNFLKKHLIFQFTCVMIPKYAMLA